MLQLWVKGALAGVEHSGKFTNGAIEAYHRWMKEIDLAGRRRLIGRRIDWLVYTLLHQVHNRYRCGPPPPEAVPCAPLLAARLPGLLGNRVRTSQT
jgi:hypothetical protein